MNHNDAEITDVMVVLNCVDAAQVQATLDKLKALGLSGATLNAETNVVEGSIDSCLVKDLGRVECVRYVRPVFSYIADYPPGDPRDKDGPEEAGDDENA